MKRIGLLIVLVAGVALLAACAPGWGGSPWGGWGGGMGGNGMMGPGMMGGGMGGNGMMGQGMMGGGMMGGGSGTYNPNAKPITIDQAAEATRRYLTTYGQDLALTEVMEFAQNFYAEVAEKDTGTHAMELLIDRSTGQVSPEMGPNMMWNTKYGQMTRMMGSYYRNTQPTTNMSVSPQQAKKFAQTWLDANLGGVTVAEADTFYGYYTLHTLRDGQVEGMLSVNGANGAVWYHTWHGPFIGTKEFD